MALFEVNDRLEAYEFGSHLLPLTMREGPQTSYDIASYLRFETEQDFIDWLERLETIEQMLAGYEALMREGMARGLVQPRVVMERVVHQLELLVTGEPKSNAFYRPFDSEVLDQFAAAEDIRARAEVAISDSVIPAFSNFKAFFVNEYLPACREQPGVGVSEEGLAFYEYLAKHFTTTSLTPVEIHQIGLDEVARLRSEMYEVMDEVGFEGELLDFFDFLRTDPQFYYSSSEELLQAYMATSKRLDPALVSLFGKLPRTPYGVKAIPDEIAPDTTTAYYMQPAVDGSRAGYYYVNLYAPQSRPIWEIEVLSVHEAVPGHHLQIALAQEQESLPPFRREMGIGAFVEGWGLYSERLGYEMGLYQDPYSKFGQLTYDMWRSIRLVVDTGIHAMGWSREEAIEYFKQNAPKSELDIVNEIDRYIGWPGQALGYKIGQLKILELRAYAETSLGSEFDIRRFHDALLENGSVPLDVLDARMREWVSEEKLR
jgi:prolyl oligopeptidase